MSAFIIDVSVAIIAVCVVGAIVWLWFRMPGHGDGKDAGAGLERTPPKDK